MRDSVKCPHCGDLKERPEGLAWCRDCGNYFKVHSRLAVVDNGQEFQDIGIDESLEDAIYSVSQHCKKAKPKYAPAGIYPSGMRKCKNCGGWIYKLRSGDWTHQKRKWREDRA